MLAKMQRISTFALTIDSWTSGANRSYMSVTAHGITKDWSFESFFLALVPVKQSETAEYISDMVTEVLTDWNIHKHNRASCTTDGAANARNATTLLGIPWVYCVAHAVNRSIRLALQKEPIKALMKKAKRIVRLFKSSPKAARMPEFFSRCTEGWTQSSQFPFRTCSG